MKNVFMLKENLLIVFKGQLLLQRNQLLLVIEQHLAIGAQACFEHITSVSSVQALTDNVMIQNRDKGPT
jgi:hypothetical protein